MTINLYSNVSEPTVVDKVIVSITSLEGVLRNESPISEPSILIECDDVAVSDLIRANYAQIPEFGRYYYIQECTQIRNHLWMLDLKCDVLKSFQQFILLSMAIVDQTTDEGIERVNEYMSDDSFVTTVKDKTDIIQFPDGFSSSPHYILITAGGTAV